MSDMDGSGSLISHSEVTNSQPSIIDTSVTNEDEEIDTLPSESDSDDVTISEDFEESDAEREWKESLEQLELLLSMVIVPYMGKYFGRKFAYWGWKQYMEWKYPVEIVISDPTRFKAAGAVQAAATL